MNMNLMQYRDCSDHYGQYYPFLISHSQERNPKRVSEAVHESSARTNVIVPRHPDRLPEAERITPIIYVWGGQAESITNLVEIGSKLVVPLRKNVRFAQGIVLFKESTLYQGFSCNSTGGLQ